MPLGSNTFLFIGGGAQLGGHSKHFDTFEGLGRKYNKENCPSSLVTL